MTNEMVGTRRNRLVKLRRTALNSMLERRYGVRTSGNVDLSDLGLQSTERVNYVPSGWMALGCVLPPDSVAPSDVFIDFGAGKGRIVLQAADYPFRKVIGVEAVGGAYPHRAG